MRSLLSWTLICLLFGSPGASAQCDLSRNGAHPNAAALMKEPFFWATIDDNAPFGNDAGSGAARNFCRWRKDHPLNGPIASLNEFLDSWQIPLITWDELDTVAIHRFITTPKDADKAFSKQIAQDIQEGMDSIPSDSGIKNLMGLICIINQDEATIGTAFAQLTLEGRLNPILKAHAEKSIQRQLLPIILRNLGSPGQQNLRKERLTKMLKVIQQAKP